jgi:hypothetical protein
MGTEGLRKCCHCEVWFRPHPRNAAHQRYCLAPPCRAASKRASQQKWHRRNPGYFHGPDYVKKVQAWRRAHPWYWRKGAAGGVPADPRALQDVILSQTVEEETVRTSRNQISRPLQEIVLAQSHALVGLASMISGEALQESLAGVLSACYERGQRIGGSVPWMQPQEVKHERARTDCAAATAPHSAAVQLGGSPSGP